jgi:hypothetical protein
MNIVFLVKHGKDGSDIRDMLVQVYGDNAAMKKTAVYKWVCYAPKGIGCAQKHKRYNIMPKSLSKICEKKET